MSLTAFDRRQLRSALGSETLAKTVADILDRFADLGGPITADTNELNIATGVTATAAEINQACDESANSEVVTATRPILAADSGKTFFLSAAGGFTSSLPAPAAGLRYRFIDNTAPTGASYVIAATSTLQFGMVWNRAGTAGVAGAAATNVNLVLNQAIIGDWIEVWSDGVKWFYHGMTDVGAGSTAT
jgi:hypothetical protein